MRWRFPTFVCAALFAFLFGLFITTGDTYAVEDISVSFPAGYSFSSWEDVFPDCNANCLSLYNYLIITTDDSIPPSSSSGFGLNFRNSYGAGGNGWYLAVNYKVLPSIYTLHFYSGSSAEYNALSFYGSGSLTIPITFTLTEDYQSGSPSGNIDITQNGQYDVTNYATATVNIPAEVIYGDYHDDLISINNSIIICAAVCLVLYFFYCIYRLIIRNSGVK